MGAALDAAISALVDPAKEEAQSPADIERLLAQVAPMFPITTRDTADYAEVEFGNGEGHSSQAMTMNPDHWNALNKLFYTLSALRNGDEGVRG